MAVTSEYKATDVGVVEEGHGDVEKAGHVPTGLQTVGQRQPNGLEVCILTDAPCGLTTLLSSITALHQPRSCRELCHHHSCLLGVVRGHVPIRPHERRPCIHFLRLFIGWCGCVYSRVFAGRTGFDVTFYHVYCTM